MGSDLEQTLEAKEAAVEGGGRPQVTVFDLIKRQETAFARALPAHITAERFTRIALTEIRRTPKLAQCTPESLLGGLMLSAQLGLEPGPLGHAYLVPFWNNKLKSNEATFIVGYRGMIDLARRSGQLLDIHAEIVYEGDEFDYVLGLNRDIVHRPTLIHKNRGGVRGAYAIARYKDGGHDMVWLPVEDIEKYRNRSKAKDNGPWVTDFEAMCMKTAIRRLAPFLPQSPEFARVLTTDEGTVKFDGVDLVADNVIDAASIEAAVVDSDSTADDSGGPDSTPHAAPESGPPAEDSAPDAPSAAEGFSAEAGDGDASMAEQEPGGATSSPPGSDPEDGGAQESLPVDGRAAAKASMAKAKPPEPKG